jgi:hypothetical protein
MTVVIYSAMTPEGPTSFKMTEAYWRNYPGRQVILETAEEVEGIDVAAMMADLCETWEDPWPEDSSQFLANFSEGVSDEPSYPNSPMAPSVSSLRHQATRPSQGYPQAN